MAQHSNFYQSLRIHLNIDPVKAERFFLKEIDSSIDLLTFKDVPYKGVNSIITNGVSSFEGGIGSELVFSFEASSLHDEVDPAAFVITYVQFCYLRRMGVYAGGFYNAGQDVLKSYSFKGIYITHPIYFSNDLVLGESEIRTLWIIPIYESECVFLEEHGGHDFGQLLEKLDPDLARLDRPPVV